MVCEDEWAFQGKNHVKLNL